MEDLFILGTDTGVGKTVLSLCLMRYLATRGCDPVYLKPVQTGCATPDDEGSDARFIHAHVDTLTGKECSGSVIYCFREPKAPLFAARSEGRQVDFPFLVEEIGRRGGKGRPRVIEGAGGLFVPLAEGRMMIDLVEKTGARPVIAARAGLGTINHTLLTIEALRSRRIASPGVVLIDGGGTPTPRAMIEENIEAIERASGVRVSGVIPRIADFDRPLDFLDPVLKGLAGLGVQRRESR
ncbi:MAG: dethiobiotin synthase [Syntrophales bacterium]